MTTLADCFFESRARVTGRTGPMVTRGAEALSAGDFVGHVHGLALALEADGIRPGQRLAVIAGARAEAMVIDWACFLLGAISVSLDPSWSTSDLGRALRNAGAHWVFHGDGAERKVATLTASLPTAPRLIALDAHSDVPGTTWTRLLARQAERRGAIPLARFRDRVQPDDPAMIVYLPSSAPEGLVSSHRMVMAALAGVEERLPLDASDQVLSTLPSYHPFQRLLALVCWRWGLPLIHEDTDTDTGPAAPLDTLARQPTVICASAEVLEARGLDSSVRRLVTTSTLASEVRDDLLAKGVEVLQATCAAGCVLALDTITDGTPAEALGRSIAGVALRVGKQDEILARGPAIPERLWQCEDGGSRLGRDGWLRTGLRGWVDPAAVLFRHDGVASESDGDEAAPSTTAS